MAAEPGQGPGGSSSVRWIPTTHFLRERYAPWEGFRAASREAVGAGRCGNPNLAGKPQTLEDLKFDNYFKEIFLDSDTKVALVSGAPSEVPQDWFLTNDMAVEARAKVNARLGARRLMAHAIFTPGYPDGSRKWTGPSPSSADSFKGYTIGDNTHKDKSQHRGGWTTRSSSTRPTR
jgi:hypothetical protein